ncbi:MAG: hypothetical protein K0U54_13795 [Bacteroidetes bacterium]|nr:hypothetical protein [Bacteroidota bacterium]
MKTVVLDATWMQQKSTTPFPCEVYKSARYFFDSKMLEIAKDTQILF